MICPISRDLVLNQSPISTVFQIVRFRFAPTLVLSGDSLYFQDEICQSAQSAMELTIQAKDKIVEVSGQAKDEIVEVSGQTKDKILDLLGKLKEKIVNLTTTESMDTEPEVATPGMADKLKNIVGLADEDWE